MSAAEMSRIEMSRIGMPRIGMPLPEMSRIGMPLTGMSLAEMTNHQEKVMPLVAHLAELRRRLLWCLGFLVLGFGLAFAFSEQIFAFLITPLAKAGQDNAQGVTRLIFTALYEQFFLQVRIGFTVGFALAFPLIADQMWRFFAPALYKNERNVALPLLFCSPLLFLAGAAFVYLLVMPAAWDFFLSFQQTAQTPDALAIELEPKVDQYFDLVLKLVFAFGLCFQLPLILILLVATGLSSVASLAKKRRYAIVLAFIAAAILTPPDPISQLLLALPIVLLYEISIWLGWLVERKRRAKQRDLDLAAGVVRDEP